MNDTSPRIAVLLSGGVDSSTALFLLREQGYHLTAFYLKIWLEDELSYLGSCPWEEDLSYAEEVSRMAGVKLEVVPLQREYYERVVKYTVDELREGRTPSPDVMCNSRIKFDAFFDRVRDFDFVATGHYARTARDADGTVRLLRAPDPVKDQTYFLAHLTQNQVKKLVFPVGGMMKAGVRAYAGSLMLPNRARKDSQGICFLGKVRYPEFVRHYLGERQGKIVERETGRVLGTHSGYWFHTVGQRQGLGLAGGPWYVCGKDVTENVVYVSGKEASREKARREFTARNPNWITGVPKTGRLSVKLRHGPRLVPSTVETMGGDRLRIVMDSGDEGVAPGQFAVLYDGEECAGCGAIE